MREMLKFKGNHIFKLVAAFVLGFMMMTDMSAKTFAAPKQMPDGNIFDPEFYAATYPDVVAALGTNETILYNHYLLCGSKEGRLPYDFSSQVLGNQFKVENKLSEKSINIKEIEGALNKEAVLSSPVDIKNIPDMALFFGRRSSSEEAVEKSDFGFQIIQLESEEEGKILLQYFEILQNLFGFKRTTSYNMNWNENNPFGSKLVEGYWAVGFTFTPENIGQELSCFGSKEPCDLFVYGGKNTVVLNYSPFFNIVDMNHRYAGYLGADDICCPVGEYVNDAFEKNGDSYYNKSNQVLKVRSGVRKEYRFSYYTGYKGEATVIINGKDTGAATAEIEKISYRDYYEFDIDSIGNVSGQKLYLRLPADEMKDGAVFLLRDFLSGHQVRKEKDCYVLKYVPSDAAKAIEADFNTSVRGCVEACTIRVLKWDPTGVEDCVLYISMNMMFNGEPLKVECLLSAPVNDSGILEAQQETLIKESESSFDRDSSVEKWEPYIPEHSKSDCLTCGGDGDCIYCNGYGEREVYAGGGDTVTSKCNYCRGSGDCKKCGGTGKRE